MPIQIDDIKRAGERIKPRVKESPVLTSHSIDAMLGANLFFKCENFQKTGSFKIRGATNAVCSLTDEELKHGIITHSSGNHGAAIAQAALWKKAQCYVVTPQNAPQIKKDMLIRLGVKVSYSDATIESRIAETEKIVKKTGAAVIHPYDNDRVIAGAGTAAYSFIHEIKNLDVLIAPIGGGGLLSGTSIAAKGLSSKIKVIGAEPVLADDAFQSFYTKKLQPQRPPKTIADGLRTSLCQRTFNIITQYVDQIITVSDEEIIASMFLIWERMKIIVEPSSSVSLAAALKIKDQLQNKKVGIIISGGNVDIKQMITLM